MLKTEEKKTWEVIREAAPDLNVFDVFSYTKLYHNLKAAIKEVCTEVRNENIFYDDCEISGEEMLRIVENKEFPGFRERCRRRRRMLTIRCSIRETDSFAM